MKTTNLQSMTGFGRAETTIDGCLYTVNVRTLNSKQLDAHLRLPAHLKAAEPHLRRLLTEHIKRGKVDVFLQEEQRATGASSQLDTATIETYARQMRQVAHSQGLSDVGILGGILQMPDIVREPPAADENTIEQIVKLGEQAVDQVVEYRQREGQATAELFFQKIERIEALRQAVAERAPQRLIDRREKLRRHLEQLKTNVDENRFEQEVVYYLEKLDVGEELQRLESNCALFRTELQADDHLRKGKKLGFIAQEIGREINTIGSKANDGDLQRLVVQLKGELEEIKEQVLNVL